MNKKVAFGAGLGVGFVAGNFALAFITTYKVLRVAEKSGWDVSSIQNITAQLKQLKIGMDFYVELFNYIKENNPEILEDPRFQKFVDDFKFTDITKDF